MPLTDEQKEAIATLATVDTEDLDEARDALKDKAQPVFQTVFRKGYGTAQGEYEGEGGKLTKAEAEAKAAKERAEQAEADLKEAREGQPDVEKINADWQEKYNRDLEAAKGETEAEREARLKEREARKLSDLRAHLTGIDPEYARWKATEYASRLKLKENGGVELLEAGTEVPVQIPEGKTPYEVLASEIADKAPPALKVSNVDSGGGASGGGGGGGSNKWANRRKELEKEREESSKPSGPSLEERLGMNRTA